MGCCNSKGNAESPEILKDHIKEAIKTGITKQLAYFIAQLRETRISGRHLDINHLTFLHDGLSEVNLLGYALICGRKDMFQYIHKILKADPEIMEAYFSKLGQSGLSIICENNFIDLFECYAPMYMIIRKSEPKPTSRRFRETIELTDKIDKILEMIEDCNNEVTYTPIQVACYFGHISMIKCATGFVAKMEQPHKELDIHYIDESTGENCALIACKTGNYSMIKYLHTACKADFSQRNKSNENAIQILAAAAKSKHLSEFYQCLVYLIEKAAVDISYNYQETLLLLDYDKAINYFISELNKLGINVTKEQVDIEVQMKKPLRKVSSREDTTQDAVFTKFFDDLKKDDESSISLEEERNDFSCNSFVFK